MVTGTELFLGLVNNLAIFIALVAVYGTLIGHIDNVDGMRRQLILGLSFGLFAVGCMYAKIPVADGVIVDQRNAVVVLSSAFGGPLSAVLSAALAGMFRYYLGGAGVIGGIVGVCLAAFAGTVFHHWLRGRQHPRLIALGAVVSTVAILPGFLVLGDFEAGLALLKAVAVPYGTAVFLGIFLGGLLLAREERRRSIEKTRTETELVRQSALRELQRVNRAKSEFLATMSHELRTPLNAILGFSDVLCGAVAAHLTPEKRAEYARDINASGKHLLALINDILDLSTIEAGKRTLEPAVLELRPLLADCLRNVEPVAANRNIQLRLVTDEGPASIVAHDRGLRQIVLNLLSNAVKFTDAGGAVTVTAAASDGQVAIRVADTGIGIPADVLPTVTDPFTRSQSNPHIAAEGTGLGLHIVKSLVDLHGGEMAIDSTEGVGTTVTVSLPKDGRLEN